jgi:hypothetical protein
MGDDEGGGGLREQQDEDVWETTDVPCTALLDFGDI